MKKLLLFAILPAIIIGGCKKSTTPPTPTELPLPWNCGIVPIQISSSYTDGVSISGVSGVFIACNIVGNMQDINGYHNSFSRSWQRALLLDDASSVSVNSVALSATKPSSPLKANFAGFNDYLWKLVDSNTWKVTVDTGTVFTTNVTGTIPVLTSALPSSMPTKTAVSNFNYPFDFGSDNNVVDADSAYIAIYDGHTFVRSNVADARSGIATITKSQLGLLQPTDSLYTTLDGKTYNGALIACVLYNFSVKSIGGKKYAFVKQKVTLAFAKLK